MIPKFDEDESIARMVAFHKCLFYKKGQWLDFLADWLGGTEFNRDFAFPIRRSVKDIQELHSCLLYHSDIDRCEGKDYFVSIYSAPGYCPSKSKMRKEKLDYTGLVPDRIVWDFDLPKGLPKAYVALEYVLDEVRKVNDEIYNGKGAIIFSGQKGFHLHVKTSEFRNWDALHLHFNLVASDSVMDLEYTDPHVWEPARVIRIPFTLHPKTLLYCVPVAPSASIKQILKLASWERITPHEIRVGER